MVPISSENNQQQHALQYQILRQAFYSNFHYNPDKRIFTPILLDLLEKELTAEITFVHLDNSQSSAIEASDRALAQILQGQNSNLTTVVNNDGTNACAFLSMAIIDRLYGKKDIDVRSIANGIENVISSFPETLNPHRDIELCYDIYKAQNRFEFHEDFLHKKSIFISILFNQLQTDLFRLMNNLISTNRLQFLRSYNT